MEKMKENNIKSFDLGVKITYVPTNNKKKIKKE